MESDGALGWLVAAAGAATTETGLRQSHGVMVNYRYDLKKVSDNHERFAASQAVAMSPEIRSLSAAGGKLLSEEAQ